jgi:hypothetical protein
MLGQGAAALPTVGTFRTASVQYFAKANDPLIG